MSKRALRAFERTFGLALPNPRAATVRASEGPERAYGHAQRLCVRSRFGSSVQDDFVVAVCPNFDAFADLSENSNWGMQRHAKNHVFVVRRGACIGIERTGKRNSAVRSSAVLAVIPTRVIHCGSLGFVDCDVTIQRDMSHVKGEA